MGPLRLAPMNPDEKQLEVFRMLYPIFKKEVFQRRERMMHLTIFASTVLIALLISLCARVPESPPLFTGHWPIISGLGLFSGLLAYCILQQADRHRMAKQQLIELEKAVGLYKEGWRSNGEALYPHNWQSDWTVDRSVTMYLTILASLTVLVICAIIARAAMGQP